MEMKAANKAILLERYQKAAYRRQRARERAARRRQNETPEQTALRRLQDKTRAANRRKRESAEEEVTRRRRDRDRKSRGRRKEIERGAQRHRKEIERTGQRRRGRNLPSCSEKSGVYTNDATQYSQQFQLQFTKKDEKKTGPFTQDDPNKSNATTRPGPSYGPLPSANTLFDHFFLTEPTDAEQGRQLGDKSLEEPRQMVPPRLPVPTPMQVQQHPQVAASTPALRQEQVLASPVQVAAAKSMLVEKPRPREKRLLAIANHQRGVMSGLASLWKRGKLCDAGIGNGSSTIKVHKVVLSAVCPKLLSVFSADMFSHKFMQVNFPEKVSHEALKAFAEYMYNGLLNLDCDILEQLKIIANKLDMTEFEELCDSHLPNQPASALASLNNFPLIQTTMQSTTPELIDIKQEISEDELAQVLFSQESQVASLAPNKSGNASESVISPKIKIEPVGPEDDKYGHMSHQAFTSTNPSSSSLTIAASTSIASVPASSTEFAIPFSEVTDVKSTRLKASHSYEGPLISDLSPASGIVKTVHSQSSSMNKDSSKPSRSSVDGPSTSTSNEVYPIGLFTAGGDNLPLSATTQTVDGKTIDMYKTDLT